MSPAWEDGELTEMPILGPPSPPASVSGQGARVPPESRAPASWVLSPPTSTAGVSVGGARLGLRGNCGPGWRGAKSGAGRGKATFPRAQAEDAQQPDETR